jgi:hypothetical protein
MAYIDKVKSGKKTYYYLGKTLRLGANKWKKLRIRLGTEKPSRELIAKKLKQLKLEQYKILRKCSRITLKPCPGLSLRKRSLISL